MEEEVDAKKTIVDLIDCPNSLITEAISPLITENSVKKEDIVKLAECLYEKFEYNFTELAEFILLKNSEELAIPVEELIQLIRKWALDQVNLELEAEDPINAAQDNVQLNESNNEFEVHENKDAINVDNNLNSQESKGLVKDKRAELIIDNEVGEVDIRGIEQQSDSKVISDEIEKNSNTDNKSEIVDELKNDINKPEDINTITEKEQGENLVKNEHLPELSLKNEESIRLLEELFTTMHSEIQ